MNLEKINPRLKIAIWICRWKREIFFRNHGRQTVLKEKISDVRAFSCSENSQIRVLTTKIKKIKPFFLRFFVSALLSIELVKGIEPWFPFRTPNLLKH